MVLTDIDGWYLVLSNTKFTGSSELDFVNDNNLSRMLEEYPQIKNYKYYDWTKCPKEYEFLNREIILV